MTRHPNWEESLDRFLEATRHIPFKWGDNDCALSACTAVQAMTGFDPASEFRGWYNDFRSARRLLAMWDVESFEELFVQVASEAGIPEQAVMQARRGDLVLCDTEEGAALGVVDLTGEYGVFPSPAGQQRKPITHCRRSWRIG